MTAPVNTFERGIATLEFGGRVLRFRTAPNSVWWSYRLITHVENTYGGRVVQILGARTEDLTITVECGKGGWNYLRQIVNFMRDMISDQREGTPGLFTYTSRNWRLKVFALSVPYQDTFTATTREIELRFKVQEDVSGVQTALGLRSELARLADGVGFRKSEYNTSNPLGAPVGSDLLNTALQTGIGAITGSVTGVTGVS